MGVIVSSKLDMIINILLLIVHWHNTTERRHKIFGIHIHMKWKLSKSFAFVMALSDLTQKRSK